MKSDQYDKILMSLPLLVAGVPIFVVFVMVKVIRMPLEPRIRWVVTNAFPDIFKEKKKKTCCPREARWLFKDIDLTAEKELLFKVQKEFLTLLCLTLASALTTFWVLLVRDVSHDCDEGDLSKDCFQRKWISEPQDPLNCSSAAVQNLIRNGTIQVICYKIAFNFGLATGASYGSFKLSMFAVKVGTSAVLMIKTTKSLQWVRVFGALLVLGIVTSLRVVYSVIPSVAILFLDHLGAILQIGATSFIAVIFICCISWRELIDLKTQRENPQYTVLENCN